MNDQLFRQEAIDSVKKQNSIYGKTILNKKKINKLIVVIVCLTMVLIVLSFFIEISDTVESIGILDYEKTEAIVKMPEDGAISSFYVESGNFVSKGQKIAAYNTDVGNIDKYKNLQYDKENMIDLLIKKINIIENKKLILNKKNLVDVANESYKVRSLKNRLDLTGERIKNISSTIVRYKQGYKDNSISLDELNSKIMELNKEKNNYENLISEINIAKTVKVNLVFENSLNIQNLSLEESDIKEEVSKLKTELISINLLNNKLIYATQNGKIEFIFDKSNQTLNKHSEVARIVPMKNKLEAIIYLKNDALPYIKKGLKVKIKVDGIPYQKYGFVDGEIYYVSNSPHVIGDQKYYLGYVLLNVRSNYPKIMAKMEVKINIIKNKIKIYQWIIG